MTAADASVPKLVAGGYATLDSLVYEGRVTHHAGGTAANVAAILSWLGWEAHLAALLGKDAAGRRLAADLKRAGVQLAHLQQHSAVSTPQVVHEVQDGAHRFQFRCPECGRRFPRSRPLPTASADALLADIDDAAVFFFDRANAGTLALAEEFRRRNALIVFEPSTTGSSTRMDRAAEIADVVKFSDDRLSVMWSALPTPAADQVQVVTRGAHGAVARFGDAPWAECSAFPARAVDPGGAGDWTTAGLLYHLGGTRDFDEDRLVEALRFGQALAALNCEWPGARGLSEHRSPKEVLTDARRLVQAAPRRRRSTTGRRRTRRRTDACHACLAPNGVVDGAHENRRTTTA